jgi:hypothetical protein
MTIFRSRQRRNGIGDFLFGYRNEGTANECSEPEGVAPVGDRASQGNEILV